MARVTLLDGGLGQELVARSGDQPTPLWATQVMMDHPGLVYRVHADYFAAGATVATTNTYAIHRDRLAPSGLQDRFESLHRQALDEARRARDEAGGEGRIAGSLGPLVASYRPETHPLRAEAVVRYAEVARLLGPHVDVILCETVASRAHADAVLEGATHGGQPVWLAVTVDDEDGTRLRSGEKVAELEPILAGRVEAVLANCSAPEAMAPALEVLGRFGLPFGAYANGFRQITKEFLEEGATVDALEARPEMTPARYADFALQWVEQGATIVGGCCETTPAHIAEVARRLRQQGHEIT